MESTKSSSARDGLVSSANGLQQTCSKKIWRRGGGAKIAEQKANLHGIIRSHRIGLSIKFLRSHDHIMLLASAFQTFLAFLPVGVPFQATIGVGRCVGVVLVKTSFAAGITRLR
jgi:hypothetical protein